MPGPQRWRALLQETVCLLHLCVCLCQQRQELSPPFHPQLHVHLPLLLHSAQTPHQHYHPSVKHPRVVLALPVTAAAVDPHNCSSQSRDPLSLAGTFTRLQTAQERESPSPTNTPTQAATKAVDSSIQAPRQPPSQRPTTPLPERPPVCGMQTTAVATTPPRTDRPPPPTTQDPSPPQD
jgi:hypothetical protein